MTPLYLIETNHMPIFEQLQLEEALLRTDERNFCIINRGSPRSIVVGLSGNIETLIDLERARSDSVPIMKRFSGGGTVIVDEDTLFVSFLFSKQDLPVAPFPEPIMRWNADLYKNAWRLPGFDLCERDYVIGNQKCGGNAQYLRKDRWLHHSSFLWDYQDENMDYLLLPNHRPAYRENRSHTEFLCRLKDYATSAERLIDDLKRELVKRLDIRDFPREEIAIVLKREHRRATEKIILSNIQ